MSQYDPPSSPPRSRPPRAERAPRRASRRAVLATAGTTVASSLAGCSVLSADDPAPFHGGEWLQYGGGPTNANRVAGGTPEPDDHEVLAPAGWSYTPPVVHEGVVYFASERRVLAVTTDGDERWELWERPLDDDASGVLALDPDRGRLYVPTRVVPTTDGPEEPPASVTVLSTESGEVLDKTRVGTGRMYGLTVADGDVYARSATACVRLAPDGTERWRRSLDTLTYEEYNLDDSTATQVAPAVTDDAVYVPDRDALVKIDRRSGEERWRVDVDTAYAAPAVGEHGVVQTGWQETVAVERSGEVRWRRDLQSQAGAAVADGDVYLAARDLYELDAATGETNWQAHLPSDGTAAPVVTDESVLVASSGVSAFRRETGGILAEDRKRWHASVHATAYASPVVAAGRVFVVGPTGLLSLTAETDG